MMPLSPDEIDLLIATIKKAGKSILHFYQEKDYKIAYKSTSNPVTSADLQSDQIITTFLRENFPLDAIVSEEAYNIKNRAAIDHERKARKRVWFVDPLDGTKEFIAGEPHFTISVGLVDNNEPVFGVIYNPVKKLLCYGGPKYGIFANGKPVQPKPLKAETLSQLKVSFSTSESRQKLFHKVEKKLPRENIYYIGSVAYKLALVATGKCDLILSKRTKSDWDIAAGAALLKTPGFLFEDKESNPIQVNRENLNNHGLLGGRADAVALYKEFISQNRQS